MGANDAFQIQSVVLLSLVYHADVRFSKTVEVTIHILVSAPEIATQRMQISVVV